VTKRRRSAAGFIFFINGITVFSPPHAGAR